VTRFKAEKNVLEKEGMRRCHIRDGVAVCELMRWLESATVNENEELIAPSEFDGAVLDEVSVSTYLQRQREQQDKFVGLSFPTICGSGSNGAIIHYQPEEGTCRRIRRNEMLLIDSGGHYFDGTTDITRTIHLGTPTPHERACFTRVLKGVIALSRVVFPLGTPGLKLDMLARMPLWEVGLDYRHGTGHGVGSFLNVHEGPHSISVRNSPRAMEPIVSGMITSIEPGYYEEGKFGIRIENLALCREAIKHGFDDVQFLTFETLTMVPIQANVMDHNLLTLEEIEWVDLYHVRVRSSLLPLLTSKHSNLRQWIIRNTEPLRVQWGSK